MSSIPRPLGIALALWLIFSPYASATTVTDFGLDDLVRLSHAAIRARVVGRIDLNTHTRRHLLQVEDPIFGEIDTGPLDLDLLRSIDGMPDLEPGDEVLLFLNLDNQIEKVLGLRWGTYRVSGEKILDHERQPLALSRETLGRATRDVLRTESAGAADLSYEVLKQRVIELRRRYVPSTPPASSGHTVDLDRR